MKALVIIELKNEYWTKTSVDLKDKREKIASPEYQRDAEADYQIELDPTQQFQIWQGVGAAITDAAASLIWKLPAGKRHALLEELFSPKQAGFSVIRIPMGSCDFGSGDSSKERFYSYDDPIDGKADPELKAFSIGSGEIGSKTATKDLKYIVPVVQEILQINPQVKVLASPWSAPAWMKDTGKMTGKGHLKFGTVYHVNDRDVKIEEVYAQYFVKFIAAYQKLGIPVSAVTIQNEPTMPSVWPAMNWTMAELAEFGYKYLRPALDKTFPKIQIFMWDENMHVVDKPLPEMMGMKYASAFAGFALHTYAGCEENILKITKYAPEWQIWMTERRCMFEDSPAEASRIMFNRIGNYLVRHNLSAIFLWNLALDERGLPNTAGSTGRRGVITIEHKTGKIQRNLEYYMLRNFGQDVARGSKRIASDDYVEDGGAGSVAFLEPDGSIAAQFYNPTDHELTVKVRIKGDDLWQKVAIPPYGMITMHKSDHKMDESEPVKDDAFEIKPLAANYHGDLNMKL